MKVLLTKWVWKLESEPFQIQFLSFLAIIYSFSSPWILEPRLLDSRACPLLRPQRPVLVFVLSEKPLVENSGRRISFDAASLNSRKEEDGSTFKIEKSLLYALHLRVEIFSEQILWSLLLAPEIFQRTFCPFSFLFLFLGITISSASLLV